ncbi:hypothetical protein ACL9RL_08265 [Plantibacter sp. Mn2098]|uniref:hypothetical protein n=1 Tax=Plantibacter sp. Mn2098 TaxID=3395266 RepID=UPI003BC6E34C
MSGHHARHVQRKHEPRRAADAVAQADDGGVLGRRAAPLVRRSPPLPPIDDPYAAYLAWRGEGHGRSETCVCDACTESGVPSRPRRRLFTRRKD